jgi:hypothetical protein
LQYEPNVEFFLQNKRVETLPSDQRKNLQFYLHTVRTRSELYKTLANSAEVNLCIFKVALSRATVILHPRQRWADRYFGPLVPCPLPSGPALADYRNGASTIPLFYNFWPNFKSISKRRYYQIMGVDSNAEIETVE